MIVVPIRGDLAELRRWLLQHTYAMDHGHCWKRPVRGPLGNLSVRDLNSPETQRRVCVKWSFIKTHYANYPRTIAGGADLRFRVTLAVHRTANGGRIMPYDYQHAVASMIYDRLIRADSSFKDLHDHGGFKFFTFSQLEIPRRRSLPEGLQILCNDAYLWFSSVEAKLVRVLAGQLLREPEVTIRGVRMRAVRVDLLPSVSFDEGVANFVTMSPVLLRTKRDTENGVKTWDLSPEEEEFASALVRNLRRKFEEYHHRSPSGDISVESIPRFRRKRIMIQDTSHRAYLMDITLRGDPELLSFAYDCGLGEKNSMGFGMVRRG